MTLALLVIAAIMAVSSVITQFSYRQAAFAVPKAFGWLAANIVPDAASLKKLPDIVAKLLQTIVVSVMATVFATVAAFLFAILVLIGLALSS